MEVERFKDVFKGGDSFKNTGEMIGNINNVHPDDIGAGINRWVYEVLDNILNINTKTIIHLNRGVGATTTAINWLNEKASAGVKYYIIPSSSMRNDVTLKIKGVKNIKIISFINLGDYKFNEGDDIVVDNCLDFDFTDSRFSKVNSIHVMFGEDELNKQGILEKNKSIFWNGWKYIGLVQSNELDSKLYTKLNNLPYLKSEYVGDVVKFTVINDGTSASKPLSATDTTYTVGFGTQKNSAGQLVVNVPWTNTNTKYTGGLGMTTGTTYGYQKGATISYGYLGGDDKWHTNSNITPSPRTISSKAVEEWKKGYGESTETKEPTIRINLKSKLSDEVLKGLMEHLITNKIPFEYK